MTIRIARVRALRSEWPAVFIPLLAATVGVAAAAQAADSDWPAEVTSAYKLSFGGTEVGSFVFKSTSNGKSYEATSVAKVSALFGAFKWKGTTLATGGVTDAGPEPASYEMKYRTKKKAGLIRLAFDKGAVASFSVEPEKKPSPEAVPIETQHLAHVFDPMSAVLAMTRATSDKPCDRKIAVFDGKARFDLVLSYKGRERIADKKPSGQPTQLIVCRVKYAPVAGHKPKDFANPWVDYDGIEIAMRPVPSAKVYVPYQISVPTTIGSAVMTADRIDITTQNRSVIALVR